MIKFFILFLSVFFYNISVAQENNTLEEELKKVIGSENLTGAVWSTVKDGVVTSGAIGLKNSDTKEILENDDRVLIGSVTKTLIATGILHLASRGKLDIDAPVYKFSTNITFNNPWRESNPVTIRDLLNHTAGIEDSRFWQVFSTQSTSTTPLEYLFTKNPYVLKVRTIPGTRFSYSNMGYSFLGLIIEKVTKKPYETYLDKNLLVPLGMKNSTFQFTSQKGKNIDKHLAMGHFDNGKTQENIPMFLRPAGQFTTTAKDMAKFAKFLMSNGTIDGKLFIDKALLNQMGSPTSTESYKNGLKSGYQFGLSYRDRYGVVGKFHRGNTTGYIATFYLFPEQKKAFFISFNTDSETANYEKFNAILINHLEVNKPEQLNVKENLPSNIEEFEGYYKMKPVRFKLFAYLDLLFNSIKVEKKNNSLLVKSIQKETYTILPVDRNLLRKEDRVNSSHVLYKNGNVAIISDGLVTYEKVNTTYLVLMWLSLILGLIGIIFIFLRGFYFLFQKKLFKKHQVITFPFLSILGLLIPIPFLLNQSFLNLGDFTLANVLLAIVTGVLPIAMIFGSLKIWRNKTFTIDAIGTLCILQWAVVLIYWGVFPFRLWH
ncbi:CubicO group peptidase, beta-lactamase class C family [Tenacibaculum sp. MAR_2009_124]|uniref:serine hydrolase domain-containing protein n=1 Tax=Tenacibaculum sp. MAR_2009_124 TaxID=1250059 RepID=UPI000898F740|nr:serine hydrolase domain-containing protein [Tenacibaculum sp. MAR_2009_124]SED05662.1 CubicO group peptidase, beta-lactamase class C family [Tenacibaculum sp. MAR_2009_124]